MYDAAVLGLGGMGSATAAYAARQGLRVAAFDQFGPAHALGASHGRTRLIRKAYFEGADYVPLLERAYTLWKQLERDAGTELFDHCGAIFVGEPDTNVIRGTIASAQTYGLPIEVLDAATMAARYPALRLLEGETGVYEPAGGVVFPEKTVSAYIAEARSAGASLHFNTRVNGWENTADGIRVHLEGGASVDALKLAICSGPWSGRMFEELAIPLRIERNVQAWFAPAAARNAPELPAFALERGGRFFYGFPDYGDGMKCAFHHTGVFANSPESLVRTIGDADIEPLRKQLQEFIPGAAGKFLAASACMYALTPDEHFIIGQHPRNERVFIAGGFSGHGFKFVPVVGEIMAQFLGTGQTTHPVEMFSPLRFA